MFKNFKKVWRRATLWQKLIIVMGFIETPAFIFHELCHVIVGIITLTFRGFDQFIYMSGTESYEKDESGKYCKLGYYPYNLEVMTWSTGTILNRISVFLVCIAPLVGYAYLWYYLWDNTLALVYLVVAIQGFWLSKEDVQIAKKQIFYKNE
jgi:hypothetical protein